MPNVKIYVEEYVLAARKPGIEAALGPCRQLVCEELRVVPAACQIAVLAVMGLADQPLANVEFQYLATAERTPQRIRAVCGALRDFLTGPLRSPPAVRAVPLDPGRGRHVLRIPAPALATILVGSDPLGCVLICRQSAVTAVSSAINRPWAVPGRSADQGPRRVNRKPSRTCLKPSLGGKAGASRFPCADHWGHLRRGDTERAQDWALWAIGRGEQTGWTSFSTWAAAVLAEARMVRNSSPFGIRADLQAPFALKRPLRDACWQGVIALAHAAKGNSAAALEWLMRARTALTRVTDPHAVLLVAILGDQARLFDGSGSPAANAAARAFLSLALRTRSDHALEQADGP